MLYHHRPWNGEQVIFTESNPRLLALILKLCDKIADSCQLALFPKNILTIAQVQMSQEVLVLSGSGVDLDVGTLVAEELPAAMELFTIFFTLGEDTASIGVG